MKFHLVTLFPEAFASYLDSSIIGRAFKQKKISVSFYNPRDFTTDKHRTVDDKPYGGGPGMVMVVGPVLRAVKKAIGKKKDVLVVLTTPEGEQFTNRLATDWTKKYRHIVFVCGHYEGIDERLAKIIKMKKVTIGPYVLTGGELPALVMMEATARQVPGVLGNNDSLEERRTASHQVYTRPAVFKHKGKSYKVPPVLLSGDHKKIDEWRKSK